MTDKPLNDASQNDGESQPGGPDAVPGQRPDQGGAPPGREQAAPATGGEGAAGAGGPGGFGT